MRLLKALDRDRRVTAVPFQKSGVCASAGLMVEECRESAWAILPDDGRYRGAEAMNVAMAVALGTTGPMLVYSLPGIKQFEDLVYSLVASNRDRLPGDRPYCAQRPAECR